MSQNTDTLEYDYRVLQLIEERPDISQRELASQLGVSVGKTNYVLSALIERGLVKAENFKRSNNKAGYLYLLTPKGLTDKGAITARFLKRKVEEYERLKAEIAEIQLRIKEWQIKIKTPLDVYEELLKVDFLVALVNPLTAHSTMYIFRIYNDAY